ncbi:unnamed protein product [Rotaria sp. Silwood2]|nr:unnamed protein product [Rotaria sp. Silwood2]CAF3369922.1 unnamed protein product [Rotaria sp. Silwood2]CAF3458416.1 unnamed protein product [Rotaria sp. Silwood2]CAF4498054.1 unnamed protein product [Rotaria sp. Silwood2]CAF4605649.1 unnamed protein product [Rotaria sp. Silwood2]
MSQNGQTNEVDKSSDKLYLDEPSTEKELYSDKSFAFGSMQGWRASNEDCHKHLIPLDNNLANNWAFFSIFDGHNGIDTAKNAAQLIDKLILESFNEIQSNIDDCNQLNNIIKNIFIQLDTNLRELVKDHSGSIAILISPKKIFMINLGDSRGIIISKDGQVLTSTKDHKPSVRKEQERIRRAGGRISKVGNDVLRVESQLAMTRALGDYSLDKHIITAIPDLIQYERDSLAIYVIIASDGIWDVMNNEQVASFVSQRVSNTTLENIISQLFDQCLKEESSDNMTAYIIKLD